MREHITGFSVANDIRMTRSQHKGAFLIVEGAASDLKIFKNIKNEACQVIPAHNKDNAVQAHDILVEEGFVGVVTIVDADFWRLQGKVPASDSLFLTDFHDIETMILASPALGGLDV